MIHSLVNETSSNNVCGHVDLDKRGASPDCNREYNEHYTDSQLKTASTCSILGEFFILCTAGSTSTGSLQV